MDIPRIFTITESAHRIHNPYTPEKLATLGAALRLQSGASLLDLGSGSGEMLCTWARDYGITGTGIDMSPLFTEQAQRRAEELGVADRVKFIHDDAAGYGADQKGRCGSLVAQPGLAEAWPARSRAGAEPCASGGMLSSGGRIGGRCPEGSGGRKCHANAIVIYSCFQNCLSRSASSAAESLKWSGRKDGWDRYEAAKWLTMRRWLEANPMMNSRRSSGPTDFRSQRTPLIP